MAESMPVRASANKVEGVNRCECGNVRTIHRARGKRSKYLYAICDDCGTNQQTGTFWQSRFEQHYPSIEALQQAEQTAPVEELETKAEAEGEPELAEFETEPAIQGEDDESYPSPAEPMTENQPEAKPFGWKSIITGIVLGALTGGVIARF